MSGAAVYGPAFNSTTAAGQRSFRGDARPEVLAGGRRPHAADDHGKWSLSDVWSPQSTGAVRQAAKVAKNVAAGCTLVAGSAWISAHTVVPPLLSLVDTASGVRGMFDQLPLVGPVLSAALGFGGVYGYVAAAAVLVSVINTMVIGEGQAETRRNWACAHIAVGFALAPLLTVALPASSPLVGGAAACTAWLSTVLSYRLSGERPSWEGAITGLCLGLAIAPMGGMAAIGMSATRILGNAVTFICAGKIAFKLLSVWLNSSKMTRDNTAYLRSFEQIIDDNVRLNLPGVEAPNVFGCPEVVQNLVVASKELLKRKRSIGKERLLLDGHSGPNLTLVAYGIAKALNIPLFAATAAQLTAKNKTLVNVQQLFDEARQYSNTSGRPIVLFFPNAESLFQEKADAGTVDPALVKAFLTCLEGVPRQRDANLLVIASTDDPDALPVRIYQRFSKYATIPPLNRAEIDSLFAAKYADLTQAAPENGLNLPFLPADRIRDLSAQAEQARLDDEDLEIIIKNALDTVLAKRAIDSQERTEISPPFDEGAAMLAAVIENFNMTCARRGIRLPASPAAQNIGADDPWLGASPRSQHGG